ncbi:hypothetical protein SNEBB_008438 [Seison nebaliae]|nr:hypothetical protein SNEBB_008438 [Seison nebaliae]
MSDTKEKKGLKKSDSKTRVKSSSTARRSSNSSRRSSVSKSKGGVKVKEDLQRKELITSMLKQLGELDFESRVYTFQQFLTFFQMPHLIKVEQSWSDVVQPKQNIFFDSFFERYVILATNQNEKKSDTKFLIPDWYPGEFKILSSKPKLRKRYWVFQGAFELYRFESMFPRKIRVLDDTVAHIRSSSGGSGKTEWKKVLLRRNAYLYATKIDTRVDEKNNKEDSFVLKDKQGNCFIVPPSVPMRWATEIKDEELSPAYQSNEGTFTLPELLVRYEFPLDLELTSGPPITEVPNFSKKLRFHAYAIAKSIISVVVNDNGDGVLTELAPSIKFSLFSPKCLTAGAAQQQQQQQQLEKDHQNKDEGKKGKNGKEKKDKDPKKEEQELLALQKKLFEYNQLRSKLLQAYHNWIENYKILILPATEAQLTAVEMSFHASEKLRKTEEKGVEDTYSVKFKQPEQSNISLNLPRNDTMEFVASFPDDSFGDDADYDDDDLEENDKSKDRKDKSRDRSARIRSRSRSRTDPTRVKLSTAALHAAGGTPATNEEMFNAVPDKIYTTKESKESKESKK